MNCKKLTLLTLLPLLVSCGGTPDLEIPTIPEEKLEIQLPTKPTFNQGPIKSDETFDYLDIYESSDFHGAVNYYEGSSGIQIGLPRMSSFFKNKREENQGGTILISGGDMWQGSADSNLTKGYVITHSMNYMGFDSMTLGNHEFDWTDEWIKKNSAKSDFGPFLCANLRQKDTKEIPDFVKPSKVITRGDYKIGIIGTIGQIEYSISKAAIANYEFKEEAPIVSAEAQRLRNEEGCNVVIWSDHAYLKNMSTGVSGIDCAFGGHEHVSSTKMVGKVPYAATSNYGYDIAHVQLKINKSSKEVTCETNEILDCSTFAPSLSNEANVESICNQYAAITKEVKDIKIGSTSEKLVLDNHLLNIATKSMQEEAKNYASKQQLDANIIAAFHNGKGGVRSDILAGEITYGSVYTSFPFDNEVVLIKIKGKDAKSTFKKYRNLGIYHTFKNYDELEAEKDYYYVTTDYLATSKTMNLEETDFIKTELFVRDIVANKIHRLGNVNAGEFNNKTHDEYNHIY